MTGPAPAPLAAGGVPRDGDGVPPPPRRPWSERAVRWGGVAAFVVALWFAWRAIGVPPVERWQLQNAVSYLTGFLQPDFSQLSLYLEELGITLAMALWSSALAVALSVPLGLLASSNVVPWFVRWPIRRVSDLMRAVNELVFAVAFMTVVGPGPTAGMLALAVHTTGTLTKLFSEAVEAADPQPIDGIRATGAGLVQQVQFGLVPQVLPLWVSYSLYRFEANVRASTVVGLVGAGGIGQLLTESIRAFDYSRTGAILLLVVAAVVLTDLLSGRLRALVA